MYRIHLFNMKFIDYFDNAITLDVNLVDAYLEKATVLINMVYPFLIL